VAVCPGGQCQRSAAHKLTLSAVVHDSVCVCFCVAVFCLQRTVFDHRNASLRKWLLEEYIGKETRACAPIIYKNASFYQDRLGTNRGKTQKKDAFLQAGRWVWATKT
jgi:hypothetical protein